ncbi:MAG: Rrf2 family transcriptional regulator [Paludibaculum sp.]
MPPRSSKGPTGGVAFGCRPPSSPILNIVDAVDGLAEFRALTGRYGGNATNQAPCGIHDSWKALRNPIMEYLERTTILDLAKGFEQKRKNLEKILKKAKRSTTKKA